MPISIVGCASDQTQHVGTTPANTATAHADDDANAQAVAVPPVEEIRAFPRHAINAQVPPGLDEQAVAPLQGDELSKAKWSLKKIRASLPELNLANAEAVDAIGETENPEADADVPLATQRLYAAARQQILEGKNADAVRLLETALRVSPTEPALLRLLGGGWAALGNRVRSMQYLQRALAGNPDDLESQVMLGRFRIESNQIDPGMALLFDVLDREDQLSEADPALPWLTRFYLSAGLRQAGYLAQAQEQLRSFLNGPRQGLRPTRNGAELVFLDRQRAAHAVVLGDMHSRLGNPLAARQAYAAAEQAGGSGAELARRIVYTDLHLGRLDQASQRIVALVNASNGSPAALSLVEYAIAQGLPPQPVVAALRASIKDEQGPEAVTLALATAMPRDAAIALLSEHLDATPSDARVYERLVGLLAGEKATQTQRASAIRRAADAVEYEPALAARRAGALLALSSGLDPLLEAFDQLDTQQRDRASVMTLEAIVHSERGDIDHAESIMDRVLARADAPPLAQVEKARLLAIRGDYEGAQAVLATLSQDMDDPRLGHLRVRILVQMKRFPEALALLETLVAEHPEDPRFFAEKAGLLVNMDRVPDAQRTLLDAINREPQQELFYAQLFQIYEEHGDKIDNNDQAYLNLMRQMRLNIPNSRTFQIALAGLLEVRSDYDQAESILDGLLQRNPDDIDAKIILVDVYQKTGREDKANEMVEHLLELAPANRQVLEAARSHYQRTRNIAKLNEIDERWLRAQPEGLPRDIRLSAVLARGERWPEALEILDRAMADADPRQRIGVIGTMINVLSKAPLDAAEPRFQKLLADKELDFELRKDIGIMLASRYDQAGRADDFDKVMLALLKEAPGDADVNNHLGYSWAFDGKKLDEAERMIGVAVAAHPEQAAYLDSMGWVLYKRGKFDQAEAWLRRAIDAPGGENAVLYDHLGDALYQQGKADEAKTKWTQAREMMAPVNVERETDPETITVVERTTAKLDALAKQDAAVEVPVADAAVAKPAKSAPPPSVTPDAAMDK